MALVWYTPRPKLVVRKTDTAISKVKPSHRTSHHPSRSVSPDGTEFSRPNVPNRRPRKAYDEAAARRRTGVEFMRARDIMTSPVISLHVDTPLIEAWETFQKNDFWHAPVLSAEGKIVGILSDRNLVNALWQACRRGIAWNNIRSMIVRDLMRKQVLTATPETPIRTIARVLFQERIGSLPIVDKNAKLVGMLTRGDMLRVLMIGPALDVLS